MKLLGLVANLLGGGAALLLGAVLLALHAPPRATRAVLLVAARRIDAARAGAVAQFGTGRYF